MLQSRSQQVADLRDPMSRAPAPDRQEIPFRLSSLKRHKLLIVLSCAFFLILAQIYLILRPANYEAVSQLLIDHQVLQLSQQDVMFSASSLDSSTVQDQVAILGSQVISSRVVDNMGLADDPRFQRQEGGLGDRARAIIAGLLDGLADLTGDGEGNVFRNLAEAVPLQPDVPADPEERRIAAVEALRANLGVRSVGASHTIEVRYVAPDPEEAAAIVNELIDVYLQDQIEWNARAAQSASAWLRERISELGTRARVITQAVPPSRPSGPRPLIILAAAAFTGLMVGAAGAWFRDVFDSSVRSPAEAMSLVDAEYLGSAPLFKHKSRMIETPASDEAKEDSRAITTRSSSFDQALDYPRSRFTHTLQRVLLSAENVHPTGSLGIVSTGPGEGRTVISANLARLAAAGGKRVLLIDAVPYKPDLSRLFGISEREGLRDILEGRAVLEDIVWTDERTGLHVLPIGSGPESGAVSGTMWSKEMEKFLQAAQLSYDRIIFDLPPLAPVPDVRAAGEVVDALLMVIQAGAVPAPQIEAGLAAAGAARQKMLGVIFNKATSGNLDEVGAFGGRYRAAGGSYVDDRYRASAAGGTARKA